MSKYLPHIGMRNIKTSIAVFITLLLYDFIPGDRDPVYAGLAVILCIQPTVESSFRSSFDRIIGTCLGGLGGYIFMIVSTSFFDGGHNYILISIGTMILIYLCNLIKHNDATAITCIVFFLISLSDWQLVEPIAYTLNRVFDTLIGIAIALAINVFIKPKHEPQTENKELAEENTEGGEVK